MSKIYIGYDSYGVEGVDDEFIHFVFDVVISMAQLSTDLQAGLVLTSDAHMQKLNYKYRGQDRPANVLSFGYLETAKGDFVDGDTDDKNYLGDIYISRAQLVGQARLAKVPQRDEFARLFVHGLLHLAGIHHETAAQSKRMETIEKQIVDQVCST